METDETFSSRDSVTATASPLPADAPDPVAWRPIDAAPKDGSWFLAYRPPADSGRWQTLIAVCWDAEAGDFAWPCDDVYDPYNPPDLTERDENGFYAVDTFEGFGTFTHWMPLPPAPDLTALSDGVIERVARDPGARCSRCGARHIEHDLFAGEFVCADRRGAFEPSEAP
jgi:hypothetical protein